MHLKTKICGMSEMKRSDRQTNLLGNFDHLWRQIKQYFFQA